MPTRRLASFLLGLWLGGSVFMTFVATQNFASVDRLLNSPDPAAAKMIRTLGLENARMLLRHQVAEQNRFYFESWEWSQIALGIALVVTLFFASKGNLWVLGFSLAMLILVIFVRVMVTPEITGLGRGIDFVPKGVPSPARDQFWRFHAAYSGIEVMKLIIGVGLVGYLFWHRAKRKSRGRREVDEVDDADHRHVDR